MARLYVVFGWGKPVVAGTRRRYPRFGVEPVGIPSLQGRMSKIEGTGVGDAGFAGIAALDAADAEEFFTAAFEIGFDGFYAGRWHDQDHADAHIEGLQEFVGFDFSERGKKCEDGRDGPGSEIDLRFDAGRQNAGQVAGNSAAGDVR